MSSSIRLALVLHNHQPVGNFDAVIEQAYQESYKPFLDVFADYAGKLKLSLHTSGCLMEWLAVRHPEYLDRLAEYAAAGSIEIVAENDTIAPPKSSEMLNTLIKSTDNEIMRFPVGHIGLSTSSKGPKLIWPKVAQWIGQRSVVL